MNLNHTFILGRLTQDPEYREIEKTGIKVATFSMATNMFYKDKEGEKQQKVEYHNIAVYGNMAKAAKDYLKKGQMALIEGRLQTRSWEKEDGSKGYKTEIIASIVQFGPRANAEGKDDIPVDTGDQTPAKPQKQGKKGGKKASVGVPTAVNYPKEEIRAEDIPF